MPIKIQTKHSAVKDKAPQPTDLIAGELAVNVHQDSPAIYLKDAAGAVRKLAGVGSVSTPVASDTVQGIVELATDAEATAGTDATRAVTPANLKAALAAQAGSPTAPAAPVVGQVWVDSSTSPSTIKVWGGTPAAWIAQAGAMVTSATAPATPAKGQIWIDTSATPNVTKIWDGTAWVAATPDGSAAAAIANDAKYATKAELQTEDLWDRTGTEISPKTAGDSVFTSGAVKVGGTLPASPNITLKADGGGYFAGKVGIGNPSTTAKLLVYGDGTTNEALNILNPSSTNGASLVFGDSVADAAIKTVPYAGSRTELAFFVNGRNQERVRVTGAGDLLLGGTLPASPNITLKADGNINAKGAVARVYADNAAAKAGGLVDGDIYRTATGQLMIVFT